MSGFNIIDSDSEEIDIQRDSPFQFEIPVNSNKGNNYESLFNKANISNDILSSRSSRSSSINEERPNIIVNSDEDSSSQDRRQTRNNFNRNVDNNRTSEINQKKEILYQFDRLKAKGINVPYNFDMNSDLEEMRVAYDRVKREKEVDSSIKFQRKVMMGFITGVEYVNTRYDPFGVFLQGFSEQVHGELDEYDPIFEELHEKYQMSDSQIAPELRLMISLGGSAFMYHLTSKMFSNEKLPKVEEVLKNNPNLMKQFQHAAADTYMGTNTMGNNTRPERQQQGSDDIFSMVSGLFGNMNSEPVNEVDSIINNVHNNISLVQKDDMVETMTISDTEIASIIEDTADMTLLGQDEKKPRRKKKSSNGRTLDL
tara:strand:- start:6949 stop:8055 length:1107 start_codon:yes stop_codon:yes gene_type:complete